MGGSQSTWTVPTNAWGEHANSMQKNPRLTPVCMFFPCMCGLSLYFSDVHPQFQNMTVRSVGCFNLSIGLSVCMRGCLSFVSLCCPVIDRFVFFTLKFKRYLATI
ncbi:hypothetical protein AMECASPLE_037839 [Ameca splendens]|uniref:Uncharacterized protein n=1 Tax=Ameca splendens TaxID=208324 RepID=A0ABV0YWN5_9TELE